MSRRPTASTLAIAVACATVAAAAGAQTHPSRGPMESRDEFLLAQSTLSLPPTAARVLPAGWTEVRVDFDWGNDFGIEADPGRARAELLYFVDGEHRTAAVTLRRGLGGGWAAGVRLPVHWRGGGWLDGVIDPFHDLFGFPDSGRPLYARGRLRVEGRTPEREPIAWEGRAGTGLGGVEAEVTKALRGAGDGGPAIAVAARVQLPTGSGGFADVGGAGAQALVSHALGSKVDLHGGAGATLLGPAERDGIEYARTRAHGFVAFEWRPVPAWSALVQGEAAGRQVRGIDRFPGFQLSLRIGSKVDLGPRWRVEGGFVEGIKSLENTIDFGIFAAVRRRL